MCTIRSLHIQRNPKKELTLANRFTIYIYDQVQGFCVTNKIRPVQVGEDRKGQDEREEKGGFKVVIRKYRLP